MYDLKDKDIHLMYVELYRTKGTKRIKQKPIYEVINFGEFEVQYALLQYVLGTK